jgi:hypothetical protein
LGSFSDRSLSKRSPEGSAVVAADDFIAGGSTLSQVCVQGVFLDNTLEAADPDCGELITDRQVGDALGEHSSFQVKIYDSDGPGGLPGTLLQTRATRLDFKTKEFAAGWFNGIDEWRLQLTLTQVANPGVPESIILTQGHCYWIEVSGDPVAANPPTADNCDWYWFTRSSTGSARDGNELYAYRAGTGEWIPGSNDLVFCLDMNFAPGGCGSSSGACCTPDCEAVVAGSVAAPSCSTASAKACDSADSNASWDPAETCGTLPCGDTPPMGNTCQTTTPNNCPGNNTGTCSGGPNAGDPCDNAEDCAPDGACNCAPNGPLLLTTPANAPASLNFTNNCATTDGPNPFGSAASNTLEDDLWVQYVATCSGRLVIDNCGTASGYGTGGGFDSFIAVYFDPANRTTCACPTSNATLWPDGQLGSDEGCNLAFGGPGILRSEENVVAGDCFMIRVGGWQGDNGSGALRVNCEQVTCETAAPAELAQADNNAGAGVNLVDLKINRMLGIRAPGSAGLTQKIRVEFVSLPSPWNVWNGRKFYVTEPFTGCEAASIGYGSACPAGVPTYPVAGLSCDPNDAHGMDWSTIPGGVVYVRHPGIVPQPDPPTAGSEEVPVYEIRMIDDTCDINDPSSFSDAKIVQQVRWGDLVGARDASTPSADKWLAPEGTATSVAIGTDVTSMLDKFGNRAGSPIKARVDTEPCVTDGKINIPDVSRVLDAFRGIRYPFSPTGGFGCTSNDPCTYGQAGSVAAGN